MCTGPIVCTNRSHRFDPPLVFEPGLVLGPTSCVCGGLTVEFKGGLMYTTMNAPKPSDNTFSIELETPV